MPKTQPNGNYDLKDSPFYKLNSKKKLADLLRVSYETLIIIAADSDLYIRRWKHKALDLWLKTEPQGDEAHNYRPIDIPDPRLKAMQSRIATLLGRIAPPAFLFSPVKGRSYVDNAAQHTCSKAYCMLDIADYFSSCSANNVARFFGRDLSCSQDVTAVLVRIATHRGCLPQGSPCSPILAYYSNQPMWAEIVTLVQKAGCKISIYADDITISGQTVRKSMIWMVKKAIYRHGMRIKRSKELSLISTPANITGVIVKDSKRCIPNRQLKKLAELKASRAATRDPKLRKKLANQIAGRRAQRRQVERVSNSH